MKIRKLSSIRYLILFIFSLVFIFPFVYAGYTSLLKMQDVDKLVPISKLIISNYQYVLSQGIGKWYLNSIIVTACILLGNIIINTMAAYVIARVKFPGRNIIFFVIIGMMMIPYQIIIIPLYTTLVKLGWLNTYACLTVPFLFQGFLVFLMSWSVL